MALAKDQIPHDSGMGSKVQSCVFNENAVEITTLRVNEYHKSVLEEEDGSQSTNGFSNDSAITHSPPLCGNGYTYKGTNYHHLEEEQQSLIDFKASCYNNLTQVASESLLNFEQNRMVPVNTYMKDDISVWENNLHHQWSQISPRNTSELRPVQDSSCFQSSSSSYSAKEKQLHGESSSYGWLYSHQTIPAHHCIQDPGVQEPISKKRISLAENMKAAKKQCTNESKMAKPNKSGASKDPQSVAAKNRRERISERLKILQELVPNGSKVVDLVTMLEKAISYVKFLQLQVKVLAADEFWPVQGGKAPDISQVKEAIDAILSSQRSEKEVQPQSR